MKITKTKSELRSALMNIKKIKIRNPLRSDGISKNKNPWSAPLRFFLIGFSDFILIRLSGTTLVKIKNNKKKRSVIPLVLCVHLAFNQCWSPPKDELNTRNKIKRRLFNCRLVSLFVLNSNTYVGKNALHLA